MDQSINTPWMRGMNYGMGVNLLNGDIAGKGVDPGVVTGPTNAGGQIVNYSVMLLNSLEELYSSIGISVEVSGHYGLFSGEGKFKYSNEVKFNTQSTFLLARCVVENAFTQCEDAQIKSEAGELIRQGKKEAFQNRFGDGFIRGMQTGGEFFAIISITSSSQEEQTSVGAELKAKYGGILASVEVDTKLDSTTKSKVAKTDIRISTYQRGGLGDEQGFTKDIEAVMERLVAFPKFVQANPVPYDVQVANYTTLALPEGPNPIDIQAQKDALEGYARIRLKLLSLQNDIEFLQLHPDYFVNPPDITTLNQWSEFVTDQLNQLKTQASNCVNKPVDGSKVFPFKLPDDFRLVPRKITNAITVKAGALSWFKNLPMNKIDAPKGFVAQAKLLTEFSETTTPGFMGIGFGIVSERSGRILCFFKGVGSGGRALAGMVSAVNGADEGIAIAKKHWLAYSEDEIYLRMSKKGNQVIDMSFSRNGEDWNIYAENIDLTTMGFEAEDTYKVLLTAYSTCNLAVSGKFFDINITEI